MPQSLFSKLRGTLFRQEGGNLFSVRKDRSINHSNMSRKTGGGGTEGRVVFFPFPNTDEEKKINKNL